MSLCLHLETVQKEASVMEICEVFDKEWSACVLPTNNACLVSCTSLCIVRVITTVNKFLYHFKLLVYFFSIPTNVITLNFPDVTSKLHMLLSMKL
jgi:hypothetical protein